MRRVSIFGATGSIGQNTIDLIRRDRAAYEVVALTGAGNIAQLAADAINLGAEIAVTAREDRLDDLRAALAGSDVIAAAGARAIDADALAASARGDIDESEVHVAPHVVQPDPVTGARTLGDGVEGGVERS